MLTIGFILFALSSSAFSSEDHHDHENGKAIGKNKAVMDVDEDKGFKLSREAIRTLGIKTETLRGNVLPKSAYVVEEDRTGFYILRAGYFKYLDINQLKNLKPDDQVAIEGVGILKITEVYLGDDSEYGHGH